MHAQALAKVLEDTVATKQENQNSESKLNDNINNLRKDMDMKFIELRKDMIEMKSELIKWVFGISFAQAALVISILKFFH